LKTASTTLSMAVHSLAMLGEAQGRTPTPQDLSHTPEVWARPRRTKRGGISTIHVPVPVGWQGLKKVRPEFCTEIDRTLN